MSSPDATAKVCTRCGVLTSLSGFDRDAKGKLGRAARCKPCRTASQGPRKSNPQWDARYRERHRDRYLAQRRAWDQRNPEKVRAQRAVRKAVFRRQLIKPARCEDCGRNCQLHGHHTDYSKWLEVRWLCPACHKQAHAVVVGEHRVDVESAA